jgi:hypothetical protein
MKSNKLTKVDEKKEEAMRQRETRREKYSMI